MNIFAKFKETAFSVLPVMLVVLALGLTAAPLSFGVMTRFVLGGILVIFGLTLFLLGVDIGILPIGERSGAALTAKRSLPLLLGAAFLIGFIVTVADIGISNRAARRNFAAARDCDVAGDCRLGSLIGRGDVHRVEVFNS